MMEVIVTILVIVMFFLVHQWYRAMHALRSAGEAFQAISEAFTELTVEQALLKHRLEQLEKVNGTIQ